MNTLLVRGLCLLGTLVSLTAGQSSITKCYGGIFSERLCLGGLVVQVVRADYSFSSCPLNQCCPDNGDCSLSIEEVKPERYQQILDTCDGKDSCGSLIADWTTNNGRCPGASAVSDYMTIYFNCIQTGTATIRATTTPPLWPPTGTSGTGDTSSLAVSDGTGTDGTGVTEAQRGSSGGTSAGVIVAAIFGTMLVLLLICFAIMYYAHKRDPPWAEKIPRLSVKIEWDPKSLFRREQKVKLDHSTYMPSANGNAYIDPEKIHRSAKYNPGYTSDTYEGVEHPQPPPRVESAYGGAQVVTTPQQAIDMMNTPDVMKRMASTKSADSVNFDEFDDTDMEDDDDTYDAIGTIGSTTMSDSNNATSDYIDDIYETPVDINSSAIRDSAISVTTMPETDEKVVINDEIYYNPCNKQSHPNSGSILSEEDNTDTYYNDHKEESKTSSDESQYYDLHRKVHHSSAHSYQTMTPKESPYVKRPVLASSSDDNSYYSHIDEEDNIYSDVVIP